MADNLYGMAGGHLIARQQALEEAKGLAYIAASQAQARHMEALDRKAQAELDQQRAISEALQQSGGKWARESDPLWQASNLQLKFGDIKGATETMSGASLVDARQASERMRNADAANKVLTGQMEELRALEGAARQVDSQESFDRMIDWYEDQFKRPSPIPRGAPYQQAVPLLQSITLKRNEALRLQLDRERLASQLDEARSRERQREFNRGQAERRTVEMERRGKFWRKAGGGKVLPGASQQDIDIARNVVMELAFPDESLSKMSDNVKQTVGEIATMVADDAEALHRAQPNMPRREAILEAARRAKQAGEFTPLDRSLAEFRLRKDIEFKRKGRDPQSAIPLTPETKPAELVLGKIYRSPDGRLATYEGMVQGRPKFKLYVPATGLPPEEEVDDLDEDE